MSRRHEQKHLRHNRSNRRYRDCAQIARPLLGRCVCQRLHIGSKKPVWLRICARFGLNLRPESFDVEHAFRKRPPRPEDGLFRIVIGVSESDL
jgi:hypothetical protein